MSKYRRDPHHPLCVFGDKYGLTPRELGFLLGLDEQTIRCFEADEGITDEWVLEWVQDPMMTEEQLGKRVRNAMMASYLDLGVLPEEAEEKIRKRASPVRRWRKSKGLTQEAAATLLGITASALSRYEHNDRTVPDRILDLICGELA